MLTNRKIAATMSAAGMLAAGFGATAAVSLPASASTGPAASATGAATSSGRTYVMMNSGRQGTTQSAYYAPSRFYLLKGGPDLFTKHTRWSWGKNSATGSGPLYGADLNVEYLGHVTLRLSDRKSNAHFTSTGKRF